MQASLAPTAQRALHCSHLPKTCTVNYTRMWATFPILPPPLRIGGNPCSHRLQYCHRRVLRLQHFLANERTTAVSSAVKMPPQAIAPAAPAGGAGAAPAPASKGSGFIWTVLRMFLLWWFIKNFFGQRNTLNNSPREDLLLPKYEKGYPLDVAMYLAEIPHFSLYK